MHKKHATVTQLNDGTFHMKAHITPTNGGLMSQEPIETSHSDLGSVMSAMRKHFGKGGGTTHQSPIPGGKRGSVIYDRDKDAQQSLAQR